MTREEATEHVLEAMRAKGVTFAAAAEALGRPKVWTAAALLGQHPLDGGESERIAGLLDLPDETVAVLREVPLRGGLDTPVPTDPTIYRFYEVLQVYGPALKALIHEEFGDGIMSAIAFNMDVEREPAEDGDRVKVTMSGKFLPYKW